MTALIKQQIQFAKKVSPSKRLDFSWKNMVIEKAEEESFLEWCRKEKPIELVPDIQYVKPDKLSLKLLVRAFFP